MTWVGLFILWNVLAVPALWIVIDVLAFRRGGYELTETAQIRRWSRRHALVPWMAGFAVGFLVCHFWGVPL